jgi:hypothetical protein
LKAGNALMRELGYTDMIVRRSPRPAYSPAAVPVGWLLEVPQARVQALSVVRGAVGGAVLDGRLRVRSRIGAQSFPATQANQEV